MSKSTHKHAPPKGVWGYPPPHPEHCLDSRSSKMGSIAILVRAFMTASLRYHGLDQLSVDKDDNEKSQLNVDIALLHSELNETLYHPSIYQGGA